MEQQLSASPRHRPGRPSEQKILAMIEEYEQSGYSVVDYCQINELNESTFSSWLARFRGKGNPKGFIPVSISPGIGEQEAPIFAEYRGIRFYQWVEPAYLKELLS